MATESDHLEQARLNLDLAQRLDAATWIGRQWACTMYFYSSIHCIEATVRARKGANPVGQYRGRHDWREAWMDVNARALAGGYKKLRLASQRARYDLVRPSEGELQSCAAAAREILNKAEAHNLVTSAPP